MVRDETIVAPITPPGRGPVAIVRVSGQKTRSVVEELVEKSAEVLARPRRAVFSPVFDRLASDCPVLDDALVIFFSAPQSFTGEDCAEFHLHGSVYLVERLMQNMLALHCRAAEPGEFSARAFHYGKIDLVQAEAVADLISAETEAQARLARGQLEGRLSSAIALLGEPLRDLLAEIEAQLDFPDEDVGSPERVRWQEALSAVQAQVADYIASYRTGRLQREGALVVLLGQPNAGKSSLLNRLAGEDRAIVTDIPGTTRDTIEEHLSIAGMLVRVCDTAGLPGSIPRKLDPVERLGVERTRKLTAQADLALFLLEPGSVLEAQLKILEEIRPSCARLELVVNKRDTLSDQEEEALKARLLQRWPASLFISALTGEGLPALKEKIREIAADGHSGSAAVISNLRHLEALKNAQISLANVMQTIEAGLSFEFAAFELRSALSSLDDIIGVTTTEDVLGRIFSRFCIGK